MRLKDTYNTQPCRGFIALFFVLSMASFLTVLIYSVSHNFSYTLSMLVNFKKLDNSRSSALYCKYKLLNNLLINIEYIPAVKTDITTPYGSTCRYDSYKHVSSQEVEVVIVGKNKQYQNISPQNESNNELINNPISRSITLRYTYNITGDFYDYVRKVEGAQISMD